MKRTVIGRGGLGNQMFQYAFYVMLRHYHHCQFDFSLYEYVRMHNGFELSEIFTLNPEIDEFTKIPTILSRILLKLWTFPVKRDIFKFVPNIENSLYPFYVGDWQSERWFANHKEEILKAFTFKSISNRNKREATQITKQTSVSVHIRRGDYIGNQLYAECATIEYYIHAIEYMRQRFHDCTFWIFSNDIAWCKRNLAPFVGKEAKYVDWNTGNNSYQDMYLMSRCRHNIIANSSFSWWGAYLNTNPEKLVIAPEKWLNTQNTEYYQDIIPDSWTRL